MLTLESEEQRQDPGCLGTRESNNHMRNFICPSVGGEHRVMAPHDIPRAGGQGSSDHALWGDEGRTGPLEETSHGFTWTWLEKDVQF